MKDLLTNSELEKVSKVIRAVHHIFFGLGIAACAISCGCTPPPEFKPNLVEIKKAEMLKLEAGKQIPAAQLQDLQQFLADGFGTPDAAKFPKLTPDEKEEDGLVKQVNLQASAGAVLSNQEGKAQGLYREHCVHCHGISGDGAGPTAMFLNPYPRDFRLGKFKFKSTPLFTPPTHEDLYKVLYNGIPGTAMPAFKRLPKEELDSLVDYVKYLTVRGKSERDLLAILMEEYDEKLDLIATADEKKAAEAAAEKAEADGAEAPLAPIFTQEEAVAEVVGATVEKWLGAVDSVTVVPASPEWVANPSHPDHVAKVERGRELFRTVGSCAQCHGNTGLGDGQLNDFDDWTKDWMKDAGILPNETEKIRQMVALGALPPRNISPRNLRQGVFRGGNEVRDIYLRIKNGIEGTPMPAAAVTLSPDDIWCLVEFVRQMPYEQINRPTRLGNKNEKATQ